MIIDFNPEYRKYWKRWAQYKGSTSTYTLFTQRLSSDHRYKLMVDTYISSNLTPTQRQYKLEGMLYYG